MNFDRIAFDLINIALFFCIVKQLTITSLAVNLRWNDRNHWERDWRILIPTVLLNDNIFSIRFKRNSAKCDLLQRAAGQITEQAICLFSQYFYFEKYVAIGKFNQMHAKVSLPTNSTFDWTWISTFRGTYWHRNFQIWN